MSSSTAILTAIFVFVYPLCITRLSPEAKEGYYIIDKDTRYNFLHYKKKAYYFESVQLYKKVMYSTILVFLHDYP